MKFFFCDVETTGLNPEKHGIVQIAGQIIVDKKIVEEFDFRVRPFDYQEIDPKALDVNGLTEIEIGSFPAPEIVYRDLKEILDAHSNKFDRSDKFFFVGYNSKFDSGFIRKFLENCGDIFYNSYFFAPDLDVMQLALVMLMPERKKMKDFKLVTVCEHLGINTEGKLHDAKHDIYLTKEVFKKFYERKKS